MQPPPLPPPLPSASSPYANPYAAPVARLQEFDTGDLVLASRGTRLGAAEAAWVVGSVAHQHVVGVAQADGDQPLIHHRPVEQELQPRAPLVAARLDDGVGQRSGDQLPPDVQIACEPAQRQAVHQRQRQVGGRDQCQQQGQEKAELQAEEFHHAGHNARARGSLPASRSTWRYIATNVSAYFHGVGGNS